MNNLIIPTVEDNDGRVTKNWDIFSRLLKDRIIMLNGEVNNASASVIIAQMRFLNSEDKKAPIEFYINSPGGSVTDGLAIFDTMRLIQAPVHTICCGQAASMGAFLLSQGEKGHRYATKFSEIMIHQPLGGFQGQATDFQIHAERMQNTKRTLTKLLADSTNGDISEEEMSELCERDYFMDAEEALSLSLIDSVI